MRCQLERLHVRGELVVVTPRSTQPDTPKRPTATRPAAYCKRRDSGANRKIEASGVHDRVSGIKGVAISGR